MVNPPDTVKEIAELSQAYNNIPLKKKIFQLENEVIELQKEIRILKQRLGNQEEMLPTGKHNYVFRGETGPYCPTCWLKAYKAVLLPVAQKYTMGRGRYCRICKETFYEEDERYQVQIKPYMR